MSSKKNHSTTKSEIVSKLSANIMYSYYKNMNLYIIYNLGILGELKKLEFDHTSFILNYIYGIYGDGRRESIIHLIFDSDVTTLRAVINNPFYTRAPCSKRSCCLPLRFLRPSKSHPTGGVSDKLEETRAHAVYTGCDGLPLLFYSRFILRSPPECHYTLYARRLPRRQPPTLHLTAWTTKSVSYRPRVITPKPNFRFILSPRRLSTPLEKSRDVFIYFYFFPPSIFIQPSLYTLSRRDHFHTTAFLRILLFLRGKKKNFVRVLMNLTPSERFCVLLH